MGNLYDGVRVFDAVTDTNASSANINALQDQLAARIPALKTMTDTRYYPIPPMLWSAIGSAWNLDGGEDPLRWEEETHVSGSKLYIPVCFPQAGSVLRSLGVAVEGASTETGGDISLWRQPIIGGAARTLVAAVDASDPWAHDTITWKTVSGLGIVFDMNYSYFLICSNATGSIADNYVYGCQVGVEIVAPV